MFVSGEDNTKAIQELTGTPGQLDCAVAFFGQGALDWLTNSTGRIICNLNSGGTNPNVIRALLDGNRFKVKKHPLLHAKVYIGNTEAVVSSANFSANGLGLEERELAGWIEAGYKVVDLEDLRKVRDWFSALWDTATEITQEDIEAAMEAWNRRQQVRPVLPNAAPESLFNVLRENPERLRNREIYLVITNDRMGENARRALVGIRDNGAYGINVDAYENWPDLPENAYFIDFYVGPRAGFDYFGLFKSPEERILVNFGNDEEDTLFLCYRQANILGYVITRQDQELLRQRGNALFNQQEIGEGDEDGKYIPLIEARKLLFHE